MRAYSWGPLGLLLMLLLATGGQAQDITTNLTLHLTCNETSGTTAADSAGTAQNGTLRNGASFVTGHPDTGNGCSLDGTNDDIAVTDHNDLDMGTGDFTVALWINTIAATADQAFVSKGDPYNPSNTGWALRWFAHQANDPLAVFLNDGNAAGGVSANFNLGNISGAWHHLIVVFDRDVGVTTYLDNSQVGTNQTTYTARQNSASTATALTIGSNNNGANLFSGAIFDDIRLYQRALTSGDRAALYAYTERARRSPLLY